jgi:hypothetical protein
MEFCAEGSRHTVVRPKNSLAWISLVEAKRRHPLGGSKGTMPLRMPVLGQDDMGEPRHEAIYQRDNFIAAWHGKRAAGTKIVLNIYNYKGRMRKDF